MPVDTLDPDESTGLLGDFNGTIVNTVWSTPRAETHGKAKGDNADKLKLYWTVRVDEILQDDYDGPDVETVTLSWGVGNGWAVEQDDINIRHEDDADDVDDAGSVSKPMRIKGNSGLGQFLGLITGSRKVYSTQYGQPKVMDGGEDPPTYDLTGCADYLRENGISDSRDRTIWLGTQYHFRGLGMKYNEDREPWMNPLPVEFLGVDKEVASGVIDPDYSPEPSQAASAIPVESVATLLPTDAEPATVEAVTSLVNASKSFNKFMKDALLLDGVEPGTELGDAVMDENNGPWSLKG